MGQFRTPVIPVALLILVCLFLATDTVLAAEEVRHRLSFPSDREQYVFVRSEFPVNAAVTELIMPNWTPGSYLIRDFAANVDRISVQSEGGTLLQVQKVSKNRWQVKTGQSDTLIVDYEVFTPELNVRSSWASREFSLINGASIFLYTEQSRDLPQLLEIDTTAERGSVFTSLSTGTGGNDYLAVDYDELVDSPVVLGVAPTYHFKVSRQDYVLLNVGENEFWDGEQAAADVEEIVSATQAFWKTNPLTKPFWFLNFAVEAKGGLEHDHSTVIMTGRRQMRDRDSYIQWLGVVAHEFFHVWNVRHMRPANLAEYDYQNEQYTSQLWLAEGLTSYYDNLMMSRAGLINPDEYLVLLAKSIHRLEMTPGRKKRPVTEASFDAWIRNYQPNPNAINSSVSYYTKGAVIGFVLDTYIRKESKGRHSLDDVMRKMYSLYATKPYTEQAFRQIVIEFGGPAAGVFLQKLLMTTVDPDVDKALDWYGLKLDRSLHASEGKTNGIPVKSGLGVIWDEDKPGLVVKSVLAGSNGAVAGVISGDEVLAVGDERLTQINFDNIMTSFPPGDETRLLISRRGQIIHLDIKLDTALPEKFEIVLQSGAGKRHLRRLQSLLGQSLIN
jgi:predicted metalloprotease with PDZ domain